MRAFNPMLLALLLVPGNALAVKTFLNYSNQTSNSVCAGGVESTYAADNAARTKALLVGYGFDVRTSDDFYGSNAAAASWGATSFLSIHSNAGGGHGAETLKGWYGNSASFASKIQAGLMTQIPYQSRGVKDGSCNGGRCKVLNYSGQTAALVEVVFHDCCKTSGYQGHPPSEAAYLKSTSGRQEIATGLAKGICNYHSVSCSGSVTPSNGSIKGVVYKNGDLTQHIAPATVKLSTGTTVTYGGSAVWSFDVPAGSYSITASATGYQTATKTCGAVVAGTTTWCSIELQPVVPDAGRPLVDAGQPLVDAGQPLVDAGQPLVDAGQPLVDAGQPLVDAGGPQIEDGGSESEAAAAAVDPEDVAIGAGCDCASNSGTDLGLLALPALLLALRPRRRAR